MGFVPQQSVREGGGGAGGGEREAAADRHLDRGCIFLPPVRYRPVIAAARAVNHERSRPREWGIGVQLTTDKGK